MINRIGIKPIKFDDLEQGRWPWTTSNCSEFRVISQIWEKTTAKRIEDRPVLLATELHSPLNVLFSVVGPYRLDYVDICW